MSTAGATTPPLLEVRDLKVWFGKKDRHHKPVKAVDGIDLMVAAGETLGLVGESGSGKTTVGRAIVGLQRPTAGEVLVEGHNIHRRRSVSPELRRAVQMIFQDPYSSMDPRQKVGRAVEEVLLIHGLADKRARAERVASLLDQVGLLDEHRTRHPHELSGGQRQRAAIARALAAEPRLIVCDEPVTALDVSIQAQVINLLIALQDELSIGYVLVSHDLSVVRYVAHRVAVMHLGRAVETGSRTALYDDARHPYTIALMSAVPSAEVSASKPPRVVVAGEPPDPANPPPGCSFHPRCWLRSQLQRPPLCEQEEPCLRQPPDAADGHLVSCHFVEQVRAHLPALRANAS